MSTPTSACPQPLPLTTPFSLPGSCTAILVLTTYNATTTITPPGAPFSFVSTYPTSDLSLYGLVAGHATSPPGLGSGSGSGGGGGPRRFHDPGCYPERYGELRAAWFRSHGWDGGGGNGGGSGMTAATTTAGCGVDGGLLPTYYSPGVCPSLWSSLNVAAVVVRRTTTAADQAGAAETGAETKIETETAATCCPPEFTIPAGAGSEAPVYCESAVTAPTNVYAPDADGWTPVSAGVVRAAGVEIRWREGDRLPAFYGDGSAAGRDSTLSTGAKAGIGVAVGLGGVALGTGILGLWLGRRRRERKGKADGVDEGTGSSEREDKGWVRSADGVGELDGGRASQRLELPVEERKVEMDGEGKGLVKEDVEGMEAGKDGQAREDVKNEQGTRLRDDDVVAELE